MKKTEYYDIIIIGSGAGGGTIGQSLGMSSAKILILERGDFIPKEDENWDPKAVWKDLRYRPNETWLDHQGREFQPYTHYCVGGNTKFWGSVLYRLRREDFHESEHIDGISPAWPIDYDSLEPYYERAERLYHVHGQQGVDPTEGSRGAYPHAAIPHDPGMAEIVEKLQSQGLHPSPLPLGLVRPGEAGGCILCDTCNSFPCKRHAKSDTEVCCIQDAVKQPNVSLWTNSYAQRLITDPMGRRVEAVEVNRNGEQIRLRASLFIVSCGAVNSAALLMRSANDRHPDGLANSSGLVGKRYMAHLATMLAGIRLFKKNPTVFQKTVAINDFYFRGLGGRFPLGQIQSQGRTHAVMAQIVVPWIPLRPYEWYVSRCVDWLVMTEDLPKVENRISLQSDGRIRLDYAPTNLKAHRQLIQETRRLLRSLGLRFLVQHSHKRKNTTHQCGTLCFGTNPRQSVLDPYCRSHDVDNLFVVDASFFPSSAAVNPGLTIAAQALRVADHILDNDLK